MSAVVQNVGVVSGFAVFFPSWKTGSYKVKSNVVLLCALAETLMAGDIDNEDL